MSAFTSKLFKEFSENSKYVREGFLFKIPTMCMGKVDVSPDDDGHEEIDEDIYNGTYITRHGGSARVAFHAETNTYCLVASKTAVNLRGGRDEDGHIMASQDGLSKSYIIEAYRLKEDGGNADDIRNNLSDALDAYNLEAGKRAKKLFTQYSARFTSKEPVHKGVDKVEFTEIFTNGIAAYEVKGGNNPIDDDCSVVFHAAVKREVDLSAGGRKRHFSEMDFSDTFLSSNITKISKPLATGEGYASIRATIDGHWSGSSDEKGMASKLWDQDDLYAGEGGLFASQKLRAKTVNYINKHKKSVLATSIVATGIFAVNPAAGLGIAVAGAFGHTISEKITHGAFDGAEDGWARLKRAKKRKNIKDYGYKEDCSDYFKVHTENNLSPEKIAPKIDMEKFDAKDFVFMDSKGFPLMDNMEVVDGLRPEDIRSLLLLGHQRGFTSTVTFLDRKTRVDAFQNGIMRVMNKQQDGTFVVNAQYRDDLCVNDAVRLPQVYIDQFKGGGIRVEYDPKKPFKDSMVVKAGVLPSEAINEICHTQLFRNQAYTDQDVKDRSISIISELFVPIRDGHEGPIIENPSYLSMNPYGAADADAIAPVDTLDV